MYFRYQRYLKRNPAPWVVACGTHANPVVVEYQTSEVVVEVGKNVDGDSLYVGGMHGVVNNQDVEDSRIVGGGIVVLAADQ